MKAKELAAKLLEDPEKDVLFQDPNAHGGPFGVERAEVKVSEGEFPKDFQMPKGFKYWLLQS